METSRKNDDCYFYYYSTCMKGDNCAFRHEPVALGNETMCTFWQQGKCVKPHCNYRHMELRKNRKQIPCYWENQPSGCRKPHCPFMHANPKDGATADPEKSKDISTILASSGVRDNPGVERSEGQVESAAREGRGQPAQEAGERVDGGGSDGDVGKGGARRGSQASSEASYVGSPPVDPVVVNFEEESDNESVPTSSPAKKSLRKRIHVKTLEEIRLEQIQAESAAFYGYKAGNAEAGNALDDESSSPEDVHHLSRDGGGWEGVGGELRLWKNFQNGVSGGKVVVSLKSRSAREREKADELGFEVMSLSEIRRRRLREEKEPSPGAPESNVPTTQVTRYAPADTSVPERTDSPAWDDSSVVTEPSRVRKRAHSPIVFDSMVKRKATVEELDGAAKVNNESASSCSESSKVCSGPVEACGREVPMKRTRRLVRTGVDQGAVKGPKVVRLMRNRLDVAAGEVETTSQISSECEGGRRVDVTSVSNSDEVSEAKCLRGEDVIERDDSRMDSMEEATVCENSASSDKFGGKGNLLKSAVVNECSARKDSVDFCRETSDLSKDVSKDKDLSLKLGDDEDDDDYLGDEQGLVTSTCVGVDEDIIQDIDEFLNN
ncbi:zinc finger CCCH domain-containing protein 11A-like [Ischnura elegans]|uniref:zinc finger CCCH domain-containing protein 11A-like n=1 Tax=Ischnura elegans TaxID=197161 RepID=UPI001ED8B273|nr:zinc finger CCCH domain-containing protein 11A-like [Ischnura elegans]XP_046393988.1 zinc finger CCCH domain-containing protein 11A-like [Ischnura elegans]